MDIVHLIFTPIFYFIISIYFQSLLDKDEFSQSYLLFVLGLISGLILKFIITILNNFFYLKASFMVILLKSIIIYGLIFAFLLIISLYIIFDFFLDISTNQSFLLRSIFVFSYIMGIWSILIIFDVKDNIFPNNPLYYFAFLSFIMLKSILFSFFYDKFTNSYHQVNRLVSAIFIFFILSIILSIHFFLTFYSYNYYYFFILLFIIIVIVFKFLNYSIFEK